MVCKRFTSMPSSPQCPHPRRATVPSRYPPRYLRYGVYSTVGTDKSMCMLAIASPARFARRHALEQAESATDSPPPGRLATGITAPQEDASLRRLSEKRP